MYLCTSKRSKALSERLCRNGVSANFNGKNFSTLC